MSEYIRRFAAPLALGLALVAGACSDEGDGDALGQDSSLSRDLALAGLGRGVPVRRRLAAGVGASDIEANRHR